MSLYNEIKNFKYLVIYCAENKLGRVGYFLQDMDNWDGLARVVRRYYDSYCVEFNEDKGMIIYTDCSRKSVDELNVSIDCDYY